MLRADIKSEKKSTSEAAAKIGPTGISTSIGRVRRAAPHYCESVTLQATAISDEEAKEQRVLGRWIDFHSGLHVSPELLKIALKLVEYYRHSTIFSPPWQYR